MLMFFALVWCFFECLLFGNILAGWKYFAIAFVNWNAFDWKTSNRSQTCGPNGEKEKSMTSLRHMDIDLFSKTWKFGGLNWYLGTNSTCLLQHAVQIQETLFIMNIGVTFVGMLVAFTTIRISYIKLRLTSIIFLVIGWLMLAFVNQSSILLVQTSLLLVGISSYLVWLTSIYGLTHFPQRRVYTVLGLLCGAVDSGRSLAIVVAICQRLVTVNRVPFIVLGAAAIPLLIVTPILVIWGEFRQPIKMKESLSSPESSPCPSNSRRPSTVVMDNTDDTGPAPMRELMKCIFSRGFLSHCFIFGVIRLFLEFQNRNGYITMGKSNGYDLTKGETFFYVGSVLDCIGIFCGGFLGVVFDSYIETARGRCRSKVRQQETPLVAMHICVLCFTILTALVSLVPNIVFHSLLFLGITLTRTTILVYLIRYIAFRYKTRLFFPLFTILHCITSSFMIFTWPLEIVVTGYLEHSTFFINFGFAALATFSFCHPFLLWNKNSRNKDEAPSQIGGPSGIFPWQPCSFTPVLHQVRRTMGMFVGGGEEPLDEIVEEGEDGGSVEDLDVEKSAEDVTIGYVRRKSFIQRLLSLF